MNDTPGRMSTNAAVAIVLLLAGMGCGTIVACVWLVTR